MKTEIRNAVMNTVSVYTPQVGCKLGVREFLDQHEVMERISFG